MPYEECSALYVSSHSHGKMSCGDTVAGSDVLNALACSCPSLKLASQFHIHIVDSISHHFSFIVNTDSIYLFCYHGDTWRVCVCLCVCVCEETGDSNEQLVQHALCMKSTTGLAVCVCQGWQTWVEWKQKECVVKK